MIRRW